MGLIILSIILDVNCRLPVYSVEQIKAALDQALYCLYSHPSKKSSKARHLVDHNISQVHIKIYTLLIPFHVCFNIRSPSSMREP